MSTINIYKISAGAEENLIHELTEEKSYEISEVEHEIELDSEYFDDIHYIFSMNLYLNDHYHERNLSWGWVRQEFNERPFIYPVKPKAVLLIYETKIDAEEIEENVYAISFGYAFHTLKHYSDKDWPIRFAEHVTLIKVKSMTILSPNSLINKKINNYVNFREVMLNSGEALNQLNANLDLEEDFEDFKDKISIANSIIFEVDNPNLDSLAHIIDYITFVNNGDEILNPIPYFKEVQSRIKKEELDAELRANIFNDIRNDNENPCIDICEFLIIDGSPKFLNQFENFQLKYPHISRFEIDFLSVKEIYNFIEEKLNEEDDILKIEVSFDDSDTGDSFNYKFRNLIIYDSLEGAFVLEDGRWQTYNNKYLDDLKESLDELDVEYDEQYDFHKEEYLEFLRNKAYEDGIDFDNADKDIQDKYIDIWYKERVFNLLREDDGFICNDRFNDGVDKYNIEVADLFKLDEKSMFSVKIGGGAGLNYVIDQSLLPMKMIDNGKINEMKNEKIPRLGKDSIKNVYLWFILTRKRKLPICNGKPDLNVFRSISLKNRIDYWKKEVIMSRRNPKIRINYIDF